MKKLLLTITIGLLGVCLFAQLPDTVNTGTGANTGTGDNLRTAFGKLNANDKYLYGIISGDTIAFSKVSIYDSAYFKVFGDVGSSGDVWLTLTSTNALDTAHTEPAYIGWEMKDLPTLEEYEKDVKMINGHMERKVWYIDYETKELKSQYGWSGLGMMNTQSAYMIYHEITVRWIFEQKKQMRSFFALLIGLLLITLLKRR